MMGFLFCCLAGGRRAALAIFLASTKPNVLVGDLQNENQRKRDRGGNGTGSRRSGRRTGGRRKAAAKQVLPKFSAVGCS